jgi:hypothetical protein
MIEVTCIGGPHDGEEIVLSPETYNALCLGNCYGFQWMTDERGFIKENPSDIKLIKRHADQYLLGLDHRGNTALLYKKTLQL